MFRTWRADVGRGDTLRSGARGVFYRVAENATIAALAAYSGRVAIVRPDRYLAGVGLPGGFNATSDALGRLSQLGGNWV
jgi:hypothetical protein